MTQFKYYLIHNGIGVPHEIFRGENVGYSGFTKAELWRAKKEGHWSNEASETHIVHNLMMRGDFDPEDDEITEEQAMSYLNEWRVSGWPGRP